MGGQSIVYVQTASFYLLRIFTRDGWVVKEGKNSVYITAKWPPITLFWLIKRFPRSFTYSEITNEPKYIFTALVSVGAAAPTKFFWASILHPMILRKSDFLPLIFGQKYLSFNFLECKWNLNPHFWNPNEGCYLIKNIS